MTDTPAEREDSSIWAELRRRRVVQWTLAYAAGAWVLLQVLGFVSDSFAWPATVKQIATILLAIGLPIVVVLGWYHGDRGQQRVTGPELAVLTLLLFLGGGLLWLYAQRSEQTTPTVTAAEPALNAAADDAHPSIAVLPFENRSDESKDAYFVDGIHDDILTRLSKISALKVISRTSVEQFRNTKLSVKDIASQLGVKSILEGGVQRAGDRVRIHVQLIDAHTDAHLWAESFDRELTAANIFAIQTEVAAEIADALRTALTPAEQARAKVVPTQSLAAWEAYQLGRQHIAKRSSAGLEDAQKMFREALDLDPKFALAHVGVADTLILQSMYRLAPQESTLVRAEKSLSAALEFDRDLAEAWASSGEIASLRWQFDQAEAMFERAIDLDPNYAQAHQWYSNMLQYAGRADEALTHAQRAVELEPYSAINRSNLGLALELQGRFPEAEASYRRASTIDRSRPGPYRRVASLRAYARNRFTDAVPLVRRALEADPGGLVLVLDLANLYSDLGDDAKAIETTMQAFRRSPDEAGVQAQLALVKLYRMDTAEAVSHAKRSLEVEPRNSTALAILRDADLQKGAYHAALARYEVGYPELFAQGAPTVGWWNHVAAIDVALVLQKQGDREQADLLLDGAARLIRPIPRLGVYGVGIADARIHALHGKKARALAAVREAERAGWRSRWRFYRDFDPALASIRNEPEFKAVFADIERDMARQRAALAARPRDVPLDLAATGT